MSYRETFAEHVRICILRILAEAPGYEANNSILADSVLEYGLKASRDLVDAQLAWLDEQGLLSLRHLTKALSVSKLTDRGLDVANGHASHPGVKKRGPGE